MTKPMAVTETVETVDTEEAVSEEEDFQDLDDFDWLLGQDEAVDSDVDPDAEPVDDEDAEPDEDEALTTLKVGGAEKQVTREELVSLAQQGEDYTRKTQEVSAQREALQPLAELAQRLEADPEATLRWLSQQYDVDLAVDPETEDPRDRAIRQLTAQVQQVNNQVAMEAAKREIQAELSELEVTHGKFDREALVQFAAENRIPEMPKAYLAWVGNQTLLDRQAEAKKGKTDKAHKARQVIEQGPSRREQASVTGAKGNLTVREAFLAAAQEAGIKPRRR